MINSYPPKNIPCVVAESGTLARLGLKASWEKVDEAVAQVGWSNSAVLMVVLMGLMGDYHCDIDELPVIYIIHILCILIISKGNSKFCDFGW